MSAQQGMHPEMIKAQVRMRGKTLSKLAKENGCSAAAVITALRHPMPVGERIIAKFIGLPLHTIWPDRWTNSGQRIYPRYANKYNKN